MSEVSRAGPPYKALQVVHCARILAQKASRGHSVACSPRSRLCALVLGVLRILFPGSTVNMGIASSNFPPGLGEWCWWCFLLICSAEGAPFSHFHEGVCVSGSLAWSGAVCNHWANQSPALK